MVQRFVSHKTGRYGPCYASYINESYAANPTEVMANIDQEDVSDQIGDSFDSQCSIVIFFQTKRGFSVNDD